MKPHEIRGPIYMCALLFRRRRMQMQAPTATGRRLGRSAPTYPATPDNSSRALHAAPPAFALHLHLHLHAFVALRSVGRTRCPRVCLRALTGGALSMSIFYSSAQLSSLVSARACYC
jgi:hypothetical protein